MKYIDFASIYLSRFDLKLVCTVGQQKRKAVAFTLLVSFWSELLEKITYCSKYWPCVRCRSRLHFTLYLHITGVSYRRRSEKLSRVPWFYSQSHWTLTSSILARFSSTCPQTFAIVLVTIRFHSVPALFIYWVGGLGFRVCQQSSLITSWIVFPILPLHIPHTSHLPFSVKLI